MAVLHSELDTAEAYDPETDERTQLMAQPSTGSSVLHKKVRMSSAASSQALGPGAKAPDFTLHAMPDQTVSLADFRGRPVVLAFYPADWSLVCGDEMALFNEVLPEFRRLRAELMGISVDGAWCPLGPCARRNRRSARALGYGS